MIPGPVSPPCLAIYNLQFTPRHSNSLVFTKFARNVIIHNHFLHIQGWMWNWATKQTKKHRLLVTCYILVHDRILISWRFYKLYHKSGQITICHQPKFPWNKGTSLPKRYLLGAQVVFEVAFTAQLNATCTRAMPLKIYLLETSSWGKAANDEPTIVTTTRKTRQECWFCS